MIAYFALHQLGYGDIMLPTEARQADDGQAEAQFSAPELVCHKHSPDSEGRVYYDAVACYNEYGVRVKLFATESKWLQPGEFVTISAYEN